MDDNWEPTKDRFIAFFDYLGFSNYVMRNKHQVVSKRMNKLHKSLEHIVRAALSKKLYIGEGDNQKSITNYNAKVTMFSDSIIIFSENDSKENLMFLLLVSLEFFRKCIANNIPVKGAISHGTLTADFERNIFFGKSLIDAYHLESELQMLGIVLDQRSEKKAREYNLVDIDSPKLLKNYLVPFKGGRTNHLVVNWKIGEDGNEGVRERTKSQLLKFYNLSSGIQRKYIDNAFEFFNSDQKT